MSYSTPPHSEEAERGVIWSIFLDHESITYAAELLDGEDFYTPSNAIIFDTMKRLFMQDSPIDVITVADDLKNQKKLEAVWWNTYLMDIMTAVFTSANVNRYVSIVKDKSTLRRLLRASSAITKIAEDESIPVRETIEKAQEALFESMAGATKTAISSLKNVLNERYDTLAQLQADPSYNDNRRISTGYEGFDEKIGGFTRWNLIIVAARPSMWKTALALNFSQNLAKNGKNIIIFSLEMSRTELIDRLISAHTGIDQRKFHGGHLSDYEFSRVADAMEDLSKATIYIDDSPTGITLSEIKSKAKRMKMQQWVDLIIIDYLQLIDWPNHGNRVQEVSDISRWLKSMARELDVPIVALAQLSRAVEQRPDKRPVMADLRDSGSIEQDADIIAMLYRDDYYNDFSETPGVTNIFIRKNRNGTTGKIDMKFETHSQKFFDLIT